MASKRVCIGAIAGAQGVKGRVKIRAFTDQADAVGSYGPVSDEAGEREFTLTVTGPTKGGVVAKIDGVNDRDAAQSLKGTKLFVPREALPEPEDEAFYHADLIGLIAQSGDGEPLGQVKAVVNYGAGDLLEVAREKGQSLILPFTRQVVPVIDLAANKIVIQMPPGLLEEDGNKNDDKDGNKDGKDGKDGT